MQTPWLEFWFQALGEPVGIVLEVSDRERVAQKLYAARREYGGDELSGLSVLMSPTTMTEVWIVHKKVKKAQVDEESS